MFTYRRRAQYHETDQMGIIHHANYVKWMEEARIRYMEELGFSSPHVKWFLLILRGFFLRSVEMSLIGVW